MKTIEATINPDGSLEMDGKNFVGKECEVIDEITAQLAGKVSDDKKKPEYRRTSARNNSSTRVRR